MNNKIIALDADGVLLDYNLAYASAWQRAFGRPSGKTKDHCLILGRCKSKNSPYSAKYAQTDILGNFKGVN
jgi:phosphoglycolate phosphatase-like HAD superfamily hydrolase